MEVGFYFSAQRFFKPSDKYFWRRWPYLVLVGCFFRIERHFLSLTGMTDFHHMRCMGPVRRLLPEGPVILDKFIKFKWLDSTFRSNTSDSVTAVADHLGRTGIDPSRTSGLAIIQAYFLCEASTLTLVDDITDGFVFVVNCRWGFFFAFRVVFVIRRFVFDLLVHNICRKLLAGFVVDVVGKMIGRNVEAKSNCGACIDESTVHVRTLLLFYV